MRKTENRFFVFVCVFLTKYREWPFSYIITSYDRINIKLCLHWEFLDKEMS